MSDPYSLRDYGAMLNDGVRAVPYRDALAAAIQPDCTVVEIGTGYGAFAFLACQLGARHVHAIEPASSIHVGRSLAKRHGLEDRITWYPSLSSAVRLPEFADVLVSDMRGSLPYMPGHFAAIADARARFLKPGAAIIARRDRVYAGLIEADETWNHVVRPWGEWSFGIDMSAAEDLLANHMVSANPPASGLLDAPQRIDEIDYTTVQPRNLDLGWTTSIVRQGVAHGLLLWFETDLADGIGFSTAPDRPRPAYGRAFLPLRAPIPVAAGERIEVRVRIHDVRREPTWTWRVQRPGERRAFQSTLFGSPVATNQLARHDQAARVRLNEEGRVRHRALSLLVADRTNAEVAALLRDEFPTRFASIEDAAELVGDIAARFGELALEEVPVADPSTAD